MSEKVLELTDSNFGSEVIKSEKPVIVDFWAAWCGPCKMVAPVMEELAEAHGDKVKVAKLNIDENKEVSMKYRIMSIPTVIMFKNGEIEAQVVGARSKQDFEKSFGLS